MKKATAGFTLIEVILFLTVLSLLLSSIFVTYRSSLGNQVTSHSNQLATQLVDQCMESYVQIRRIQGYNATLLTCTPIAVLPLACAVGISAAITCTTTLSGDTSTSKVITLNYLGATPLTFLIANT